MGKKVFYKTEIRVSVLSEDPIDTSEMSIQDLADIFSSGQATGKMKVAIQESLSGNEMAQLALSQDIDPEFFGIDSDGKDLDDEEILDS